MHKLLQKTINPVTFSASQVIKLSRFRFTFSDTFARPSKSTNLGTGSHGHAEYDGEVRSDSQS